MPLAVLDPGPQQGYAVIEPLRTGSSALDLSTGIIHPALHRLDRASWMAYFAELRA